MRLGNREVEALEIQCDDGDALVTDAYFVDTGSDLSDADLDALNEKYRGDLSYYARHGDWPHEAISTDGWPAMRARIRTQIEEEKRDRTT